MITGMGVDIVDIRRIEELARKYGMHFLQKVFTPAEIDFCNAQALPSVHFAGRWAAKEAFYKALNSDMQRLATWQSIEILPENASRRPIIRVISNDLQNCLVKYGVLQLHISISHEKKNCVAMVIVE